MSRSKATKRRKVWVNLYSDRLSQVAWPSKRLAERSAQYEAIALAFIERLPGDVVLSREDVAGIKGNVAAMGAAGRMGMEAEAQMLSQWIDALLRGRR